MPMSVSNDANALATCQLSSTMSTRTPRNEVRCLIAHGRLRLAAATEAAQDFCVTPDYDPGTCAASGRTRCGRGHTPLQLRSLNERCHGRDATTMNLV